MNEQTNQLLRDLAAKLGTTAEHLFSVLANHAHVSAIYSFFVIFIWLSIPITSRIYYKRCNNLFTIKEDGYAKGDTTVYGVGFIISLIMCFVSLFMICASIRNIINGILDPQYWALEQIFDLFKK